MTRHDKERSVQCHIGMLVFPTDIRWPNTNFHEETPRGNLFHLCAPFGGSHTLPGRWVLEAWASLCIACQILCGATDNTDRHAHHVTCENMGCHTTNHYMHYSKTRRRQ
eukprot:6353598-Amphidinium_carterae.1